MAWVWIGLGILAFIISVVISLPQAMLDRAMWQLVPPGIVLAVLWVVWMVLRWHNRDLDD